MVAKGKPEPEAVKPKEPVLFPPTASGKEGRLKWEEVSIFGTSYRVRQITGKEDDEAWDAAEQDDGKYNNRILSRMQLAASVVTPKMGVDDFDELSKVELQALYFVHNRLNTLWPADTEGNA